MQRKLPDRKTKGCKDRHTLIHRTLPIMAGGLIKAPPYPSSQLVKKFIFHCIPIAVKSFFKETKMQEKIFVY